MEFEISDNHIKTEFSVDGFLTIKINKTSGEIVGRSESHVLLNNDPRAHIDDIVFRDDYVNNTIHWE